MAKALFGMVVVDMRGKLGGHVFTKARSGNTVRTKVTPSNPRTPDQQAVRARLGALSSSWSNLTEAQRLTWQNGVQAWTKKNIFAQDVIPSGKNLFVKLNTNLLNIGGAQIQICPVPSEMPALVVAMTDETAAAATISITGGSSNETVILRATAPQAVGLYNPTGRFRQIASDFEAINPPRAIGAAYAPKFGAIPAGSKIFLEVIAINMDTGTPSVPYIVSFIAT